MLHVILLNVARYLTTSLRGPAQPYTNERASASLVSPTTTLWFSVLIPRF